MTNLKHFLLSQPLLLSLYSFMFCIFFEGCNCDFSIWTEYINHCNNHTSLLVTSIMCWGPEPEPSPGQCSLRKQLTLLFATPPLFSQQNDVWETTTEIPYSDVVSLLGSTSDWLKQIFLAPQPIRYTSQIWVVIGHQNGISAVLLWCHFAGKLVVATWNFGCFLSLKLHGPLHWKDGAISRPGKTETWTNNRSNVLFKVSAHTW